MHKNHAKDFDAYSVDRFLSLCNCEMTSRGGRARIALAKQAAAD